MEKNVAFPAKKESNIGLPIIGDTCQASCIEYRKLGTISKEYRYRKLGTFKSYRLTL